MAGEINVGSIVADLQVDSTHLERGLSNARRALDAVESELKRLDQELNQGRIQLTDYTERMMALSRTEAQLTASMNAAYSATTRVHTGLEIFNQRAGTLSTASGRAGMALMQFGNIIDDIQYGFMGVVNNIGPLAFALSGGNMSVAAGAQIAAVATYQLYNNWDELMGVMGIGRVLTEAEEMDELAHKTGKTADETARLNKHKKEQAEINALLDKKPKAEEAQDKAVKDAVVEHGSRKVLDGIFRSLIAEGRGEKMTPQEQENMNIINRDFGKDSPFAKMKQQEIDKRIEAENIRRSREILGDPAKLDTLQALAKAHPDAFPKDFLKDVEKVLPEGKSRELMIKQQADLDAYNLEQSTAGMDKIEKDKDRAAKEERDFDANAENVFNSAVRDAKGMVPGADKISQLATMQSMLTGDPRFALTARAELQAELERQGLNKGVASGAANEVMKDANFKAKEDVIDEMLNGSRDREKATKSQQFDAAELAARVQAGVGGDEPKKQTGLMKQMVEHLANIEKARNGIPFGVEGS